MKKAIVALALSLPGCVSIGATVMGPKPYAGVRASASYLVNTDMSRNFAWVTGIFCVLDFLPSAVMDTLLLPVTCIVAASEAEVGAK